MFHEFAHVVYNHPPYDSVDVTQRKKHESEADEWAANWLTGGIDINSSEGLSRGLGIAQGLLFLLIPEVYYPTGGGNTHPDPTQRAWTVLEKHFRETDEWQPSSLIWAYMISSMTLHLSHTGKRDFTNKEHDSFSGCLGEMFVELIRR